MTNYRPGVRVSLAVLGLSWLIPAVAGERIHFDEEGYEARLYAAYARAVKARPMDPKDGNQIRVWRLPYKGGRSGITGYILTNEGVYRCRLTCDNSTGKYLVINPGICKGPRKIPGRLARAMATLPDIAKYASSVNSCGTFDGGGADVEGIVDGKHFQFTAMNPHDCDEARPLAEMLDRIVAAYEKDRD